MNTQVQILGPQYSTMVRTVMLCCEEKGITYQIGMQIDGNDIQFKESSHLALHPFGKIPVLIHGENHIFETAPICRYLDAAFDGPALQPTDAYQRALVDQWSQAISCYVDQALVRQYLLEFAFPKGDNGSIRLDKVADAQPEVMSTLEQLEKQLADQAYICGTQYSIADALLTPMLDYLASLPHADSLFTSGSSLLAYVARMRERPSGKLVLIPAGKS
ncbi:glutathione S-transferase family protein [Neptunomonas japonica]|uniref:glutathione transferase n=1 Tax=Neptunomonas japonica JAMM 1380 TaxID=1441457 RepID=A0A7R6SX30_9GAMM|nr:glutathione S-transferase family protein [Neptunomonas japonica]BBB31105.1 glutathione S-transferase [Neptunomonas japonica JAMM 1380]